MSHAATHVGTCELCFFNIELHEPVVWLGDAEVHIDCPDGTE